MKLTNHEKDLLDANLRILSRVFSNSEDDCYYYLDEREGEEEYYSKINSDNLSDEEAEKLENEFENKPTHYEELYDLILRIKEEANA